MQEEHPSFNRPEPEAALWRYMDFTKFVSLLETRSLYLVRADLLGDPFEGSFPELNVALRPRRYPKEFIEPISSLGQKARQMVFISCWHERDKESAAMWSLHSREHDGIAIKTECQSLWDSLENKDNTYMGRISYIDYRDSLINEGNLFDPYIYKRQEFAHEQEVRVVHCEMGSNIPNGIYHSVDLSELIKGIVVAPYAEDWFADLVRSVAGRYELGDHVTRSSLAGTPNW